MSLPVPPAAVTPDNAEFFAGLEAGRVRLPRCAACREVIWYPRHHCPFCGSNRVDWIDASGRGTVYSFTVVRRGQGDWAAAAPYVLAYVELEEGPRLLTNLVAADPGALAIGMAVEATVERVEGVPPVLRFRPLQAGR
jgi:uncharacterized OB-fold protein